MATAVSEEAVGSAVRERATEAVKQAAHLAHEARLLKSLAEDAVEDGVYAARRAAKRAQRGLADLRDEAVYRVKREPIKAMSVVLAVGVLAGVVCGWLGASCVKTNRPAKGDA